MIFRIKVIGIILIFQSFLVEAQHAHLHGAGNHVHRPDDPHNYHIGVGMAAAHVEGEQGLAPGFHLHLIRQLGAHKRWGLGLGYEAIMDEHWHNGLNLLFNYRPVHFISLLTGPGMVMAKHDGKAEVKPAFHTEAVFEFNVWGLHVGPMVGFGADREERHFSVGVHIGLGF